MGDIKTDSRNRTEYSCYPSDGKGTINNGTTLNVNYNGLSVVTHGTITNYNTQSGDLIVRFNHNTNDSIIVEPNSTLTISNEYITRIYLVNSSGSSISYQVVMFGS
jgi:hypothetical protein